jgi:Protein of unknown function (DUF1553)/Protein of unknown function (DUF1549)/Planctomycete cytochrome C
VFKPHRALWASLPLLAVFAVSVRAADDPKGLEFFENKIRPVLVNNCYECHSAKAVKLKGGLLLDTKEGMLKGGDSSKPAIVPGKPAESLLLKSLRHEKDLKMPPEKPLAPQAIADIEKWIAMGAPDPRTGAAGYKKLSLEESKSFWSFKPVANPQAPRSKDIKWAKSDIDRFILAKIEEKGLTPVADADKATLFRRTYFDLIGLPPKPEEVDAFVKDSDPKAYEKLIDRLLASPQFGERWGRYWLDIARYGESNGNADNTAFPEAWRFRDYVIKAHNEDKPYDRFVREQIAGDLLPSSNEKQKDELVIATGLLALTSKPRAQNNPDYKYDLIGDQIDVTSRAFIAMSVMCSRCHDHKFDPISTKEYYSLAGIFDSSNMLFGQPGKGGTKKTGGGGGFATLSDGGSAMACAEGSPHDLRVCIGGDAGKLGDSVPRAPFLKVATLGKQPDPIKSGSGRLELAEWISSKENPLTARVAVNRVWMHLFGQAIVRSPDNFGFLGEKPSHPELLDHLATKFMNDGWSLKKIIRYVMLSRTYQLASVHHEANFKIDPDDVYCWRMSRKRLDAEAFRDAILSISGSLDLSPAKGSLSAGFVGKKPNKSKETTHRSVYLGILRGAPLPESLALFDVANPNIITAQRDETTVPSQALYLMNSPFIIDQSRTTAQRILNVKDLDDPGRVDLAFRTFYGRPATATEKERAMQFIADMTKDLGKPADAWTSFCQVLIASAEFRYLR